MRAKLTAAFSLALIACAALPFSANAQADARDEDSLKLQPVTVTATKRAEDVKEVPISITALDDAALTAFGQAGEDIQFLTARVPSLIIETSYGRIFPRPYIRGLGNTDFDFNASQPVSFIYDEVVFENPVLKGFPVFDTDRIEVLRGPQGTLFGRNTPAGALKFESRKPTDDFEAYARGSYGNFGTGNLEGAVGGPISDRLAWRVAGVFQRRDDYIKTALPVGGANAGAYEDFAFRGQLRFDVADSITWLGNVHGRKLDGGQVSFQANAFETGRVGPRPGFDREINFADAQQFSELETDVLGANSRLEWDFGGAALTYIVGFETVETFSRGDVDGGAGAGFLPTGSTPGFIPFPAETADGIDDHQQITHELRLSNGDASRLSWTAGLYLFDEELDISSYSYDTFSNGVEVGSAFQTQDTTSRAAFANIGYDFTDRFSGQIGVRYTDEEKDFSARRVVSPFGAGPLTPAPITVGDAQVSWDASLSYAANDDTNLYFRGARGFRAPSIQGRILFGDVITTADTEIVDSYEIGLKSSLADDRLDLNLAIYTYTIEDQQLTAIGGAGNFNQLLNAEEGRGAGFEIDMRALLTEHLSLTAGWSYNKTEIRDPGLTAGICGAPCTVFNPIDPVTGGALIDGNSFPQSPASIVNLAFDYARPVGRGEVFATTDWSFRSDSNIFLYESLEFTAQARWEGGASLGYRQGPWHGKLFVRNLTDEIGTVSAIDFNNLSGIFNQPRIYGLELGWTFN